MKIVVYRLIHLSLVLLLMVGGVAHSANAPLRMRHAMVVSQETIASQVGADIMKAGGNAMDGAIATAFALAVTHPSAGNIGGGGFLLYRPAQGEPVVYDFRETAPQASRPDMWLVDGKYDAQRHHFSHLSVGVPGTVAGLHLAWREHGKLPWAQLMAPAIRLASQGFIVSDELSTSLHEGMRRMQKYPAANAQFSNNGKPFGQGERLVQKDLATTLELISRSGPDGFYKGRTAQLIVKEIQSGGGVLSLKDLADYRPVVRAPLRGTYRGYEVLTVPPPSSAAALIEMLNMFEGYDVGSMGFGTTATLHLMTEGMRRVFADRAHYLGDPGFNPDMPMQRLLSKEYAASLRTTINLQSASPSSPDSFDWPEESPQTTHLSVVDSARNAVSLTYTLESAYGSGIVAPGTGFLLNNEMGDFNAQPGLTNDQGLIGTSPNLAEPGKRMLSSMSPTILTKDGGLFMVTGSPGGRTIINTVTQTILNVVDHNMNAQVAVDAGRIHHQWLPDTVYAEKFGFSEDSLSGLRSLGHQIAMRESIGAAQVVVVNQKDGMLEGGADRRDADSTVAGF